MTDRSPDPAQFLPLTEAAFHTLLALADGDAHGYSVLKTVEAQSSGVVRLSTGTLYTLLSRLLNEGLIVDTQRRDPHDDRRRSYRLTALGRAVVRAERDRLERTLAVARSKPLLAPKRA